MKHRTSLIRLTYVLLLGVGLHSRAEVPPVPSGEAADEIKQLSLEDLMQLKVSTVSRNSEQWWSAPGAIDVLTGEDIRRGGALSLPDALRLASGVDVAQPAARTWGIGIRGFTVPGGDKINVQLDGRTLFTPFYSGVFWDAQDTMMEDIDRIEVVRGPVGAVWGDYAVNGLIEILTKPAWETQGVLASTAISTENAHVTNVRYGGQIDRDHFYRVYAQYRAWPSTYINGHAADAATDFFQTGFRADSRSGGDTTTTLQGDTYTNKDLERNGPRDEVSGANMLGRWQRLLSFDSDVQFSGYYDYTDRHFFSGLREHRHTFEFSGKYHGSFGQNELNLGTDNTISHDRIENEPDILFDPTKRTEQTFSVFANDLYHWMPGRFSTTVGAKLEHNSFSGFEVQPTLRATWTPSAATTIWSAVSRAVRTPVRFDQDVVFPGVFYASDEFKSETLIAYELGLRQKLGESLAVDLALFENHYDDLRSYQPIGAPIIPLTFRNMLNANSRGAELTVLYQPLPRLFFKGTYRYFGIDFTDDPGARDLFHARFEANDPRHMATLTTRVDLLENVQLDSTLRYVGSLPWQNTKGYVTADVHLGWAPNAHWDFSIIGRDLFDRYHAESIIPQQTGGPGREIARSVTFRATWKY